MPFHLNLLSKLPPNHASESDIYLLPTLSHIQLAAWLTSPLNRTIYPGPASTHPCIEAAMMARHRDSLLNDPTCQFISLLHCEEPEVGEPWKVIAFLKYHVFDSVAELEARTDAGKREWPEGTHVEMVEEFWARIADARQRYGRLLGRHVDVEILATLPEYQRMGAGRLLMEAACAEADRMGLPAYLEGSQEGRRLYEAAGFVGKEDLWVDLPRWADGKDKGRDWRGKGAKEGEGEGWYNQMIMLRPAKDSQS